MKTIKRYKTFDELRSAEKAASDIKASLKKHADMEAFLQKIYSIKLDRNTILKPADSNGR